VTSWGQKFFRVKNPGYVLARVLYIKTVYIDLSYVFQRKEVLFVVKFFSQAMDHVLIIYLPGNSINTSINTKSKAPTDT
jgi:hypothetical protein